LAYNLLFVDKFHGGAFGNIEKSTICSESIRRFYLLVICSITMRRSPYAPSVDPALGMLFFGLLAAVEIIIGSTSPDWRSYCDKLAKLL
ncbi:MAG: hypothetical protein LBR00_03240, partial [Clostridiales Family XIII bacterium]|nr:hypothetical protein [Clostridiales Family XIII bacterium]